MPIDQTLKSNKNGDNKMIHLSSSGPGLTSLQGGLGAIKHVMINYGIYLVLLALIAIIAITEPSFISTASLRNILLSSSTRLIMALGVAFVLISGGVDLSAGRVVGLAAVVAASMLQDPNYSRKFFPDLGLLPLAIPLILAIAAGALVGLLNGVVVAKAKIPPFIATLGTMVMVYGANLVYFDLPPNHSQPIGGLRQDFTFLGSGSLLGIPVLILIAISCAAVIWVIANKTIFGRQVYAVGGNRDAARVAGIPVQGVLIKVYMLAAAMSALAGVLEAARSGGAKSNYGEMYELDAIAACVVGGVSTTGGLGTVGGVIVGILIFAVINYGLSFIGMDPNLQFIAKGLIITLAVGLDVQKNRDRV
jgi:methyl-galactoside transport system permease protein